MIEIACLTDAGALARLQAEWDALWRRDAAATPFQSPAWLLAWWRFFGTPEPLVLTARACGRLVGLLPLYLLREDGCRKLLPLGVGLSDYVEALIDPGTSAAADLLTAAIGEISDWDECWLPDLVPDGALARATIACGVANRLDKAAPCPVLNLQHQVGLANIVPRKTLRDLRQARARTAAAGGVVIETIAAERLDGAMGDLFRLHQRSWQVRDEEGLCADPRVRDFHRAAAAGLLASGILRLYRLWVGDAVLAVYYGFVAKGTAYAYLSGFDPAEPRLSPGMQVLAHALEEACAEGLRSFDFLRGGEGYKYAWGAADRAKIALHMRR